MSRSPLKKNSKPPTGIEPMTFQILVGTLYHKILTFIYSFLDFKWDNYMLQLTSLHAKPDFIWNNCYISRRNQNLHGSLVLFQSLNFTVILH